MDSTNNEDSPSYLSFLQWFNGSQADSSEGTSYKSFVRFFSSLPTKRNVSASTIPDTIEVPPKGVSFASNDDAESSLFALNITRQGDILENGLKSDEPAEEEDADGFLRDAFELADADGNGKLTREELKLLLRKLGLKISDNVLDTWVTDIDIDVDGEVSFHEFAFIFRKEKENDRLIRILRETFETYDADGSGCIDSDELRMLMAQLGHDIAEDVAKEMISHVDKDGNGEIDFE